MNCKKCGKEFEGKFCPDCGTSATDEVQTELSQCPCCGNQRQEGSKFCANCGYNFDEPNQSVKFKAKPKKPLKKLTKKQLMTIIIPVVAVIVLIAIIVPSVIVSNNIFRVGKVDKVNIGDTQTQVVKVLGEPYKKNDYRFEYYSDNYVKLAKQIDAYYNSDFDDSDIDIDDFDEDDFEDLFDDDDKITKMEDELEKMVYKYICVEFDSNGIVTSVFFDNEKCDSKEYQKVVKSYKLLTKELVKFVATDIIYSTRFTDGSFYKGVAIKNYIASSDSKQELKWADEWKKDYSASITKIKQNPDVLDMGTCGDNAQYVLGTDGTLTITGSGAITSALPSREDYDKIIIAEGITSIDCALLKNTQAVTSITISSSVTSIGEDAFRGWSSLTSINVDLDNEVYKSDGNCLIAKETNMLILGCQNSVIPNYVTSIGDYAFYRCSSLTSITIPSSVTSIGDYAFYRCSSLTSITIPSSVTSIGDEAFSGCSSLTSIEIPSSVTSIGDEAFSGCSSLTSITIPSSVTSIGSYAFSGCSSLTIYWEITEPSGWASNWDSINRPVVWDCKEHGVTESGIKWGLTNSGIMTIAGYSGESLEIEIPSTINGNTVTSICGYAFYGYSGLTSITIPSSVTSIGDYAFYGCSSLTRITIPSSVTSIGECAFYNCSSLTSITIPSSVTSIGVAAFRGCSSLTSITIPSSVTSIGGSAFSDCSSLTIYCEAASRPSGWASYWNSSGPVVWDCKEHGVTGSGIKWGLTNSGIMTIAGYSGASSIIEIPSTINGNTVTSICDYAFYNCSSLTSIEIPSSVTSIGGNAFYGCSSLTSITIPSSVTSIGNSAFWNCSSLTSIEIPSSVTSIGYNAFYNCSSLTIRCKATSKPSGWDSRWNSSNCPVVWGYTG